MQCTELNWEVRKIYVIYVPAADKRRYFLDVPMNFGSAAELQPSSEQCGDAGAAAS